MSGKSESIVRELLGRHGRLYAEDAGIRLADRPGPLYQLLVLATRPAGRRAGARVAEPAGRQRDYRFRARLISHARYTIETCRMRPDTSFARFVCSA